MSWFHERLDRLRQIVAEAIAIGYNGDSTGFADYVLGKCACFGLRPETARQHLETLIRAWQHDRWRAYVKHNNYMNEEEIEKWMMKISRKS